MKTTINKQPTVLLGLSGGVDSSVAALLLKKQGYKVIAAFMKNFSETKNKITGECAWIEERKMAQKIASQLNIPFITLDFESQYKKQVIDPMFKAYKEGKTPNPDILCNTIIKFPLLWKEAKKLGADYISTGHYARIKHTKQGYQLLAGKDKLKDQSYFLSELSQHDLEHTLFPIGSLNKEKVRQIAKTNHFPNADKKGTRGICFVGKVNLKTFLQQKIKNKPGKVLSPEGKVIGTHPGISYYTIGQKIHPTIGIDIHKPDNRRWYIAFKDKSKNIIIAAPENSPLLKKKLVTINKLHLINPSISLPKSNLKARIRHLGEFHQGKLTKKNNQYIFTFFKPIEAIAEGQSIVIYNGDQVIASGEISKAE